MDVIIHGEVQTKFRDVKEAFSSLWQDIEVGASLCVYHRGQKVVDLWAGYTNPEMTSAWQADTLVNVYSATKGIASFAFAILVDEGKLAYEDKVIDYWPEFGAEGKQDVTIAQLLSHQAGLCGVTEKLEVEDLYDWQKMVNLLAAQKPLWALGEGVGYHAVTWGYFPGELIKRVTSKTLGEYFNEKVRKPLNADFYIGLPESEFGRCALLIGPNRARQKARVTTQGIPLPELYRISLLNPSISPFRHACSEPWRRAELAASNGHASARGMALIYAVMAMQGELKGQRIISQQGLANAIRVEVENDIDLVTGKVVRRARGFILNTESAYGPNPKAFGHAGAGGSMGFADQDAQVAFSYAMNQMQTDATTTPRSKMLTDAVYSCL
jgi:CubicO group peptidase (beta-lactamase class C family)